MENINDVKREKVRVVPIKYICDFPDHPFKVVDDENMEQLVHSIEMNGVLNPVIARRIDDEHYELISGHRRKHACILLGIDRIPLIGREMTREAFEKRKQGCEYQLEELHKQVENAKAEIAAPFPLEAELDEKCKRLAELDAELNMDKRENEIVDGVEEQSEDERDENNRTRSDRTDR